MAGRGPREAWSPAKRFSARAATRRPPALPRPVSSARRCPGRGRGRCTGPPRAPRKPRFRATKVQVSAARIVCWPLLPCRSPGRWAGRWPASARATALSCSITASSGGRGSPRAPVPKRASTIHAAPARCRARRAGSCRLPEDLQRHVRAARRMPKIHARVARQFSRARPRRARRTGVAAQVQMPGNNKAVAGIVPLAAADDDRAVSLPAPGTFGRSPLQARAGRARPPCRGRRFPSAPGRTCRIAATARRSTCRDCSRVIAWQEFMGFCSSAGKRGQPPFVRLPPRGARLRAVPANGTQRVPGPAFSLRPDLSIGRNYSRIRGARCQPCEAASG